MAIAPVGEEEEAGTGADEVDNHQRLQVVNIEVNDIRIERRKAANSLLEVTNTRRSRGIGESESGYQASEVVLDHLLGDCSGQALAAVVLTEQSHCTADVLAAGDWVGGAGLSPL